VEGRRSGLHYWDDLSAFVNGALLFHSPNSSRRQQVIVTVMKM